MRRLVRCQRGGSRIWGCSFACWPSTFGCERVHHLVALLSSPLSIYQGRLPYLCGKVQIQNRCQDFCYELSIRANPIHAIKVSEASNHIALPTSALNGSYYPTGILLSVFKETLDSSLDLTNAPNMTENPITAHRCLGKLSRMTARSWSVSTIL